MAGTVRLKGLGELQAAFTRAGRLAPSLAAKALFEEASVTFALTQEVVPVRFGVLKASGKVHPPTVLGSVAVVDITYGGPGAEYALFVHEIPPSRGGRWNTGATHDYPTRWKYLERPVKVRAKDMASRMTGRVVNMLNEGFR